VTPQVLATAKLHWLAPEQGGRKAPPSGSVYAATGRFDEPESEFFSIVLSFPAKKPPENGSAPRPVDEAEVSFLAPELVENKLAPGKKLLITEGPRIVAECEIQSVKSPQRASVGDDVRSLL